MTPGSTSDDPSIALDWDALLEQLNRRVGLETSASVTEIDRSMIRRFAAAIGAASQLYFNEEFALTTQFGGMIAPHRVRLERSSSVTFRRSSPQYRHRADAPYGRHGAHLATDTARRSALPRSHAIAEAQCARTDDKDRCFSRAPISFWTMPSSSPVAQVRIVSVSF